LERARNRNRLRALACDIPLFFFNLSNGRGHVEDDEGTEHVNLAAARQSAIKGLRDVMASELQLGDINFTSYIDIQDERHEPVCTITFTDAVKVATLDTRAAR
jgi:hypothetical protein